MAQEAVMRASKIKNNRIIINDSLKNIENNLKKFGITLKKAQKNLNELIRNLGVAAKETAEQLKQKSTNRDLLKAIEDIKKLVDICVEQRSLQNKPLSLEASQSLERINKIFGAAVGLTSQVDKSPAQVGFNRALQRLIVKFDDISREREFIPLRFFELLSDIVLLCSKDENGFYLEAICEHPDFKKIINDAGKAVAKFLLEKYEIEICFSSFLSQDPKRNNLRSQALEVLKEILSGNKMLIEKLFPISIYRNLEKQAKTLKALEKIEKFVGLSNPTDIEEVNQLAGSLFEIEFNCFEYNADILCYYYQRLNYSIDMAYETNHKSIYQKLMETRLLFEAVLTKYVCRMNFESDSGYREDKAILLMLYITAVKQDYYFDLPQVSKEALKKMSSDLAKAQQYTFYDYFDFYMSALKFINDFNKISLKQRHRQAQEILEKLRNTKKAEYHITNASPFEMLVKDGVSYLNKRVSEKLMQKNTNPDELCSLEQLLETVKPFTNPARTNAATYSSAWKIKREAEASEKMPPSQHNTRPKS